MFVLCACLVCLRGVGEEEEHFFLLVFKERLEEEQRRVVEGPDDVEQPNSSNRRTISSHKNNTHSEGQRERERETNFDDCKSNVRIDQQREIERFDEDQI